MTASCFDEAVVPSARKHVSHELVHGLCPGVLIALDFYVNRSFMRIFENTFNKAVRGVIEEHRALTQQPRKVVLWRSPSDSIDVICQLF